MILPRRKVVSNSKVDATRTAVVLAGLAAPGRAARALARANQVFTLRYYLLLPLLLSARVRRRQYSKCVLQADAAALHALRRGPVVFVTAHVGMFELGAAFLSHHFGQTLAVPVGSVRPHARQLAYSHIRRHCNLSVVPALGSLPHLEAALGGGQSVVVTIDRRPSSGGIDSTFFGHPALVTRSPAHLALVREVPIVPALTWREGRKHLMVLSEPIRVANSEDLARATHAAIAAIELGIRSAPSQWHIPSQLDQLPWRLQTNGEKRRRQTQEQFSTSRGPRLRAWSRQADAQQIAPS